MNDKKKNDNAAKENKTKESKLKINKLHITLTLIAFIIIIVLFTPIRDKLEILIGSKEKDLESIGSLNLKWDENITAKNYIGSVIVDDKETITSYTLNNKELWTRELQEGEESYLGETGFFINNEINNSIRKFDKDNKDVWSYIIENPTYTMTEIDDYLLVYSKVDESTRKISVLDNEGQIVLDKEKSNEEILSANIFTDKNNVNERKFIITSIDTSSPELKSKVTYLSNSGETIWTEDIADKIIYNILFIDNGKMLLIGDRDIICKDNEGKTLWEKEIKQNLKDVKVINKKEVAVLYGIEKSYIEVLDTDGKLKYEKDFKKDYNDIEKLDKYLMLLGKDGVVALRNENINMTNDIPLEVKQIEKIDNEVLVFTENKVEIYKVVDKEKDKTENKDK